MGPEVGKVYRHLRVVERPLVTVVSVKCHKRTIVLAVELLVGGQLGWISVTPEEWTSMYQEVA